jgi:hypothetical protein
VILQGTVSSSLDGSLLDAFAREVGGSRDSSDGPFVSLPPGTVMVKEDRVAHRFTVEIPRAPSMPIALTASRLGTRYLVTARAAQDSLTGAIEADVMEPIPLPAQIAATMSWPFAGACLAAAGAGLAFAFLLNRRNREELRLERRARAAAHRAVEEARRLGPAFEGVGEACRKVLAALEAQLREADEIAGALNRTRTLSAQAARARRAQLQAGHRLALGRMRQIVERLETAAADLAVQGQDGTAGRSFAEAMAGLERDLGSATRTEQELRAMA